MAGGSGSGKTTFANKLLELIQVNVAVLHMDSYYLDKVPENLNLKPGVPNFDHPSAFDWGLLKQHISDLKNGKSIQKPIYNFTTNSREEETVLVNPSDVIIFEGIFTLFDPEIRSMCDVKCFLQVDADIRITRRLNRDIDERKRTVDSVIKQYYETVRPMHQKYLEPQKQFADLIIGENTDVAADILANKLNSMKLNIDPTKKNESELTIN